MTIISPLSFGNKPNVKRLRKLPRQTWTDGVKEDRKILGMRNAEETAEDREERRQCVVAAMGL